jgi:hypothetical protein
MLIQIPLPEATPDLQSRRRLLVQLRRLWTDPWGLSDKWDRLLQRYLQPLSASLSAAPTVGKASFLYHYGSIKREDRSLFDGYARRNLRNLFVRIGAMRSDADPDVNNTVLWTGVILQESNRPIGTDVSVTGIAAGDLVLSALGIEGLLEQVTISSAWCSNGSGQPILINWAPAFNDRYSRGESALGNRSRSKVTINDREVYCFADDGELWTARDAAEYLLAIAQPRGVSFELGGAAEALEAFVPPALAQEGRSVWQLLDQLVDRRRGVGLAVDPAIPDTGTVTLAVYTCFETPLQIDGRTIPANDQRMIFLMQDRKDLEDVELSADTLTRYGKVTIAGERLRTCFSVSFRDGTLDAGWSAEEEAAYKSPPGVETADQDRERATDKYRHVFGAFVIPASWNWWASNGEERGARANANPAVYPDGSLMIKSQAPIRNWGHRLVDELPIRIADPSSGRGEYMPPLAVGYDELRESWVQLDRHNVPGLPTGNVRMLDEAFGVELNFSPNQCLGLHHWDGTTITSSLTPSTGNSFDWQRMILTVCAQTDQRVQATADIDGGVSDLELRITIPGVHLWYVCPNAVVQVAGGKLVRWRELHPAPAGGGDWRLDVVRDDTAVLRAAVELARQWYGRDRAVVSFVVNDLVRGMGIGTYLETVSDAAQSQPAASVITQKMYDFAAYRTQIQTSWSELEFGW